MNLAGLMSFLINVVGLVIVVSLIFIALEQPAVAPSEPIKKIARYAVGGAALLAFLVYIASILTGNGGGLLNVTPASIIEFAIGIIVLLVLLYIIELAVAWLAPAPPLAQLITFCVGAIAIIVILVLAERALFAGGLGLIPNFGNFGAHQQPSQIR